MSENGKTKTWPKKVKKLNC